MNPVDVVPYLSTLFELVRSLTFFLTKTDKTKKFISRDIFCRFMSSYIFVYTMQQLTTKIISKCRRALRTNLQLLTLRKQASTVANFAFFC